MNASRHRRAALGIAIWIVNGLIAVAFYVAEADCAYMGIGKLKPAVSSAAEVGFIIGAFCLIFFSFLWHREGSSVKRWMWMVVITLWNQACLVAFLVTLIPLFLYK